MPPSSMAAALSFLKADYAASQPRERLQKLADPISGDLERIGGIEPLVFSLEGYGSTIELYPRCGGWIRTTDFQIMTLVG